MLMVTFRSADIGENAEEEKEKEEMDSSRRVLGVRR